MIWLIGISGKKGSGKITLANAICSALPNAKRYSIADPLKRLCVDALGCDRDGVYGANKEKPSPVRGLTNREVMQRVGQYIREINPNIWIEHCLDDICSEEPSLAVIDDVRYVNEAEMIRDYGGHVIRLQTLEPSTLDAHPSETELDDYKGFTLVIPAGSESSQVLASIVINELKRKG